MVKAQLSVAVYGIIFTVFIILLLVVGIISYRYHLAVHVSVIYRRSVNSLLVPNFLSLTYNESFSVYRMVSEKDLIGKIDKDTEKNVTKLFYLLSGSRCYKVEDVDTNEIVFLNESEACKKSELREIAKGFVFKPYNPKDLVDEIEINYEG